MPASDRAFRALAPGVPDAVVTLLRALAPEGLPLDTAQPVRVQASQATALPPDLDTDWLASLGDGDLCHVECQGYRDTTFAERLIKYHLRHAVWYWPRRVRTFAVWLIVPPAAQRASQARHHDISVDLTSLIVPEVSAELLLRHPKTLCFAPAADAGDWSDEELCARVARALAGSGASFLERHMTVVSARMHSRRRCETMLGAMEWNDQEPVLIEDLIKIGQDDGFEKGLEKGLERGLEEGFAKGLGALRATLTAVLDARGLSLDDVQRARIAAEHDFERLSSWIRRAAIAKDTGSVLSD
jgi:hypothetical protein